MVELADEFVEQVSLCGGVPVALVAAAPVVVAGGLGVRGCGKAQIHPAAANWSFLMRRWLMEMDRPDAWPRSSTLRGHADTLS